MRRALAVVAPLALAVLPAGCSGTRSSSKELAATAGRPPTGADWNDYHQAVGLPAMRAELDAALCGVLVPGAAGRQG